MASVFGTALEATEAFLLASDLDAPVTFSLTDSYPELIIGINVPTTSALMEGAHAMNMATWFSIADHIKMCAMWSAVARVSVTLHAGGWVSSTYS